MTVVKMVGKQVENISEIRAWIKVCTKIGHFVRQIFTEMGEVYGSDKVNVYETVRSWKNFRLAQSPSLKVTLKSMGCDNNFAMYVLFSPIILSMVL